MGAGVLLESVPDAKKDRMEELFARMDAMGADPIFPEGANRILPLFVSISSELPARYERLHCAD